TLRAALDMQRRIYPNHLYVVRSLSSLAWVLATRGKPEEALPLFRAALAGYRRLVSDSALSRPEGDVLNLAATYPVGCADFFNTARDLKLDPASVYQEVWFSKAVLSQVFERRHLAARALAADPKAAALLTARAEARRRRADLLLAPAPAETDRKARDADLDQLNDTIAGLERDLRRLLPTLERSERLGRAGPGDLQRALPADPPSAHPFPPRTP